MVSIHGTGKFFQYLGHHLPPIPFTITRIEIWILCTILLCSAQHILIQKTKKSLLTFSQQKTSNECYHSNQSPILKFSPSNCLHFLNILPSADINHFWTRKPDVEVNSQRSGGHLVRVHLHHQPRVCFTKPAMESFVPAETREAVLKATSKDSYEPQACVCCKSSPWHPQSNGFAESIVKNAQPSASKWTKTPTLPC